MLQRVRKGIMFYAPINVNPGGRQGRAWGGDLIVFVGPGVGHLTKKKMEKVERKRKTDKDLYDVEVIEVDTTRKQLKIPFVGFSQEYDEMCDCDNKRNYFPFVRLEKMFFPQGRFAGG